MSLQIVLYTPKNAYLNHATQKNTCQIFLPPKNPGIENFKPEIILGSFPSLEIQDVTPPPPGGIHSRGGVGW